MYHLCVCVGSQEYRLSWVAGWKEGYDMGLQGRAKQGSSKLVGWYGRIAGDMTK